jgi:hypothetical protein
MSLSAEINAKVLDLAVITIVEAGTPVFVAAGNYAVWLLYRC